MTRSFLTRLFFAALAWAFFAAGFVLEGAPLLSAFSCVAGVAVMLMAEWEGVS